MEGEQHKVYLICFNPHCLKDKQRCLTTSNLHAHPTECVQFLYPAEEVTKKHWSQLDKFPIDNLGVAARKKFLVEKEKGYLSIAINNLKEKFMESMRELEEKILQLYPQKQFSRAFSNVYNLQKISQSLRLRKNPHYISSLVSDNFSAHNYHVLMRINQSYDDIRNTIDGLNSKLMANFDVIFKRHKPTPTLPQAKRALHKKINYGVFKSKFIASSKIQFNKAVISFPRLNNIASFLPWIYTDKHFNEGSHQFKISSLRYPIVQNAGFTVLEEHDIDTYPYTNFKSLFSREGKGFRLVKGQEIDQFIAQTTVIVLRIELGNSPKAYVHDSEMNCCYQCDLKENTVYRMGVYGCGWSMEVIELN